MLHAPDNNIIILLYILVVDGAMGGCSQCTIAPVNQNELYHIIFASYATDITFATCTFCSIYGPIHPFPLIGLPPFIMFLAQS